jgi:hypothetical protein
LCDLQLSRTKCHQATSRDQDGIGTAGIPLAGQVLDGIRLELSHPSAGLVKRRAAACQSLPQLRQLAQPGLAVGVGDDRASLVAVRLAAATTGCRSGPQSGPQQHPVQQLHPRQTQEML